MIYLKCSECGGEIQVVKGIAKCTKCNRKKEYKIKEKNHIKEVDMNDKTKDMDVLLE